VRDDAGNFLAWASVQPGFANHRKGMSWREEERIDAEFFCNKISGALAARGALKLADRSSGMRLLHAESDGLPGLIVDQYGDVLVMQIGSAGRNAGATPAPTSSAGAVQARVHLRTLRFRFARAGRTGRAQRRAARQVAGKR